MKKLVLRPYTTPQLALISLIFDKLIWSDKLISSLNRCDIAGFLDEVPAHGVAGVMGRVTLDAGQAAYLVEHRIDHPGVETTVAVGVGGRRKKQCRRFLFVKIEGF